MPYTDASEKSLTWDSPYGAGNGHPHGAGVFAWAPRLVREQQVVRLMEAIAKMSTCQARWLEEILGLVSREGIDQAGLFSTGG